MLPHHPPHGGRLRRLSSSVHCYLDPESPLFLSRRIPTRPEDRVQSERSMVDRPIGAALLQTSERPDSALVLLPHRELPSRLFWGRSPVGRVPESEQRPSNDRSTVVPLPRIGRWRRFPRCRAAARRPVHWGDRPSRQHRRGAGESSYGTRRALGASRGDKVGSAVACPARLQRGRLSPEETLETVPIRPIRRYLAVSSASLA